MAEDGMRGALDAREPLLDEIGGDYVERVEELVGGVDRLSKQTCHVEVVDPEELHVVGLLVHARWQIARQNVRRA